MSNTPSKKFVIGIDPGIHGAVAVLELGDKNNYKLIDCFDFPLIKFVSKKGTKITRIDLYSLTLSLEKYTNNTVLAVIEEVGRVNTNADPFSSFVFGFATGAVHGILSSLMVTIKTVTPLEWKLSTGLSSDKKLSIERAKAEFGDKFLTLKSHDGRAEAMLLGAWGIKNMMALK